MNARFFADGPSFDPLISWLRRGTLAVALMGALSPSLLWAQPANNPPTAPNGTATATSGDLKIITLPYPATDVDGDAVSLDSVTAGAGLVVNVFGDGQVSFTPSASFAGQSTLSYTVSDPFDATASGTITVTVADNDAPVFTAPVGGFTPLTLTASAGPGGTVALPSYTSQGTFVDAVDGSSLTISQEPAAGTLVGRGPQEVTITAADAAGNEVQAPLTVTVAVGAVTSAVVQSTGQPVPGAGTVAGIPAGAVWESFGVPSIIDGSKTAYAATFKAGGTVSSAIFAGDILAPAPVVFAGDLAPDATGATAGRPVFAALRDPLLCEGGKVAFLATLTGSRVAAASNQGIYTNLLGDGSLREVARTGTHPAGTASGVRYKGFSGVAAVGSADASKRAVAFVATLVQGLGGVTSANDVGVWLATDAGTKVVLREGYLVTWVGKNRAVKAIAALAPRSGAAGHGHGLESGIFLSMRVDFTDGTSALMGANATGLVALSGLFGEAAPGGGSFASFGLPVSAANTGVSIFSFAFSAEVKNGASVLKGIFAHNPEDSYHLARYAVSGGSAGSNGEKFASFGNPVLNEDGALAFAATLSGTGVDSTNNQSLWTAVADAQPQLLARKGDAATGAQPAAVIPSGVGPTPEWVKFTSLALPPTGPGPYFVAKLLNRTGTTLPAKPGPGGVTADNDTGLWARDSDGTLHLVLREGEVIGTSTVKTFTVLGAVSGSASQRRSFNNKGYVLVRVDDATGAQHLVLIGVP